MHGSRNLSLTEDQSIAQFSLWAMMASPLIMSIDVQELTPFQLSVLVNTATCKRQLLPLRFDTDWRWKPAGQHGRDRDRPGPAGAGGPRRPRAPACAGRPPAAPGTRARTVGALRLPGAANELHRQAIKLQLAVLLPRRVVGQHLRSGRRGELRHWRGPSTPRPGPRSVLLEP